MEHSENEIKEAIRKSPSYCEFWSGEGCCSYPNSWRIDTRVKVNRCKLALGKSDNKVCVISELDRNFVGRELK